MPSLEYLDGYFSKRSDELSVVLNLLYKNNKADFDLLHEVLWSWTLSKNRSKIITFGNGGSSSQALHFTAELVGRYVLERNPLPSVCLNSDVASITAISNDYGYSNVFSRQLEAITRPGDLVFAFSTSGTSQNVVSAINTANNIGLTSVCITGDLYKEDMGTITIRIPSSRTSIIQEATLILIHSMCEIIDTVYSGG